MIFNLADREPLVIRRALPPRDWNEVYQKVLSLRGHWYEAFRFDKFYTLGKAQYIVSPTAVTCPPADEAAELYDLLHDNFSDLYRDVRTALNDIVSQECIWDKRLWTPGFHLFPCTSAHQVRVSRPHCDFNYANIDWKKLGLAGEISAMFSFTLPVHFSYPDDFGIRLWNCSYADVVRSVQKREVGQDEVAKVLENAKESKIIYKVGELILHPGRFFHEILPFAEINETEFRTTLQGHGIFKNGQWYIFW